MTAAAQLVTLMASATILAPLALSLFDERSSEVNALISGMASARAIMPIL